MTLLDVQWQSDHLKSLGVIEVPRARYLEMLRGAVRHRGRRGSKGRRGAESLSAEAQRRRGAEARRCNAANVHGRWRSRDRGGRLDDGGGRGGSGHRRTAGQSAASSADGRTDCAAAGVGMDGGTARGRRQGGAGGSGARDAGAPAGARASGRAVHALSRHRIDAGTSRPASADSSHRLVVRQRRVVVALCAGASGRRTPPRRAGRVSLQLDRCRQGTPQNRRRAVPVVVGVRRHLACDLRRLRPARGDGHRRDGQPLHGAGASLQLDGHPGESIVRPNACRATCPTSSRRGNGSRRCGRRG